MKSNLIDVDDHEVIHETPKAYLVWDGESRDDDGDKKGIWLPKSQVEYDPYDKVLTMTEQLATEKGLV